MFDPVGLFFPQGASIWHLRVEVDGAFQEVERLFHLELWISLVMSTI